MGVPAAEEAGQGDCPEQHTVEWRVRPASPPEGSGGPRAAVCLLGVARFIDKTAGRLRRNLLLQLGMPYDLFTFASASREGKSGCQEFRIKDPLGPAVPNLAAVDPTVDPNASEYADEWKALASFLDESVAGQLLFDDRPLELLQSSATWRRAVRRPGAWIGGVAHKRFVRSGAGLAQLRALQWCADAVRWHEREVLGHEYTYVVYSRWDLQWLLPFPGLPLLQSQDPGAVWVPATQGEYFTNDRFGAVPREALSAYFEGWTLLVTGKADEVFESAAPWVGQPEYTTQDSNCETFLYARLKYGGVRLNGLPTLAYVQCTPSTNLGNLRTMGYFSCTSFANMFADWEPKATRALGGTKYPREFDSIVMVDSVLEAPKGNGSVDLPSLEGILDDAWRERLARLFELPGRQRSVQWTPEKLDRCAIAVIEQEIVDYLERRVCLDVEDVRLMNYKCRRMLTQIMMLAQSRSQYHKDALEVARTLVLAGPLHLESWMWLVIILMHPYWGPPTGAVGALQQAFAMNSSHIVVHALAAVLLKGGVPPASGVSLLEEALGGRNATQRLWRQRARDEKLLRQRRRLQRRCVLRDPASAEGLEAWLAYGIFLMESNWMLAAVGVFQCLEDEYLLDGRPEALRARGEAVARVRKFGDTLRTKVEDTQVWVAWGTRLEDLRRHAPSRAELLDLAWLERQESWTLVGGRDVQASSVQHVIYRWSHSWQTMLAVDLAR